MPYWNGAEGREGRVAANHPHGGGILTIRQKRLPDIDTSMAVERSGLARYGRFALTRNGSFWFGEAASSHPPDTATGWYWGITLQGELLVSARGAGLDGDALFSERKPVLARLIDELVRRRFLPRPAGVNLIP